MRMGDRSSMSRWSRSTGMGECCSVKMSDLPSVTRRLNLPYSISVIHPVTVRGGPGLALARLDCGAADLPQETTARVARASVTRATGDISAPGTRRNLGTQRYRGAVGRADGL